MDPEAEPRSIPMPGPRPWRSMAICFVFVGLIIAVGRDFAATTDLELAPTGMGARIVEDPFRLVLAGAVVAAALYAALQLLGLRKDRRVLAGGGSRGDFGTVTLRALVGRPNSGTGWPEEEALVCAGWGGDAIAGPSRLGVTAFPMVGFLGTVIGLSGAIEALPRAMEDEGALGEVLGSLHVAFDTTLLGLVGALVCLVAARAIDESVDALSRRANGTS